MNLINIKMIHIINIVNELHLLSIQDMETIIKQMKKEINRRKKSKMIKTIITYFLSLRDKNIEATINQSITESGRVWIG